MQPLKMYGVFPGFLLCIVEILQVPGGISCGEMYRVYV